MNLGPMHRRALLAAAVIGVLVFAFLPSEIYLRNAREFISTAPGLPGRLALVGLAGALALLVPLAVPGARWRRWYATTLAALVPALWFSGVFLVPDLGELDGSSFDLSRHAGTLAWQSGVFILVLAAAWLAAARWPRRLDWGVGVLGLGLALLAATNFHRAESLKDRDWEAVGVGDFARFSPDRNVLLVLMDSFQSDVLRELMREDAALRGQLDGFRFYPDTLGVAPSTYLTMPAVHSGVQYNNRMPLQEYYDLGVRDGSFFSELAANGYEVDSLNPIIGICPAGADSCARQENLLLHTGEILGNEAARLADLGILRAAPGLTKLLVFDGSSGPVNRLRGGIALTGLVMRIYQGHDLVRLIADNVRAGDGPPTARLLHLLDTHPPSMFDAECRFIGVQKTIDRRHMTLQTACAMRGFVHLLERLKAVGVYDNSLIVLGADTGAGNVWGDEDQSSLYAQEHGVPPGDLGRLIGGANPVLAIKLPNARGPVTESLVQAQLTDIPRTICAALGDCSIDEGLDLAGAVAGERERIYHYYQWKNDYWGMNRIPGMIEYRVNGPLWLEDSWSRGFSAEMPRQVSRVEFSGADAPELFGIGWGQVEVNDRGISKRWSIDRRAELYLPLPTDAELTLEFEVLTAPGLDGQEMTVKVNGETVGSRVLEHRVQFVTVTVPPGLATEPVSKIDLEFSQLQVPETGGRRNISVSFFNLDIFRADVTAPEE